LARLRELAKKTEVLAKSEKVNHFDSLINYAWYMKKDGKAEVTIKTRIARLKRLAKLCDLHDPEQVKATLATLNWQNNTKHNTVKIYTYYLNFLHRTWQPPKYAREHKLPFIPTEKELDSLICSGTPKTTTPLQLLKETGARIGEILRLKWTDIDFDRRTVYIRAEKSSNSRILPISVKLTAMLKNYPKSDSEKVFPTSQHNLRCTYQALRKRTVKKLGNPRIKKISFHTFRHWKGTMEYHKTKDIIHVKTILGHKNIESTMVYINIESALFLATSDEFTCKVANNEKEARELIESGFEYITTTPDNIMLFRKRK
jgi:integrase